LTVESNILFFETMTFKIFLIKGKFIQHKINHFKMYRSVVLSMFTMLCYPQLHIVSKQREPHTYQAFTPHIPLPLAAESTSVSMDLPILNSSYKCHIIWDLSCLVLFTNMFSRFTFYLFCEHSTRIFFVNPCYGILCLFLIV
jgi:hypothetical protein